MSDNTGEENQDNSGEQGAKDQGATSPLSDVRKKLIDELDTINLGELTESEIKRLSDMLNPYLKDKAATPPTKPASNDGMNPLEPGIKCKKNKRNSAINIYANQVITIPEFSD